MRAVLIWSFAVVACGGAPVAPPPPAPPPPVATAAAEPAPHRERPAQPARPVELAPVDPIAVLRRPGPFPVHEEPVLPAALRPRMIELPSERKSDYWSPCVRAFVETQPAAAQEVLGEALSLYGTACTVAPARVEFRAPRAGRGAPRSDLALVGALDATTCELALRAAYHGEPIHAEQLTLIADGAWWTSPRLEFERDAGGEVAELPVTRSLVRVVRRALEAHDTLLRFESARGYEDVAIGDDHKQELRALLDALDAINRP